MKKAGTLLLLLFAALWLPAQDTIKSLNALRTTVPPKIDGVLDEEAWKDAPVATGFIQTDPQYNVPETERTEVKVIYDDNAIYIGAFMFDRHPDSILHELGERDDGDLNADYFLVGFDTYNKAIDSYIFGVTASGVQIDVRTQDETYDGVWYSAVKITDKGWCAELRIPYSAIRFPDNKEQVWKAEFERRIRRRRETSRWTFIPKDQEKYVKFFGKLEGISSIKAPLRLSMTPYVSAYLVNAPEYNADGSYSYVNSYSYNTGADIKYGIDERFTLDMILLPDFGQVQSDSKVKNLSYREITYDENRPFFKEGTELFAKNSLFYSRRIGRTPALYYDVPYLLNPGDVILSNPSQTRLINATKVSGRTNSGLGIGIFNAVTNRMYAEVQDSVGNFRNILTEPLTNYNIVVLDQQLRNSSSFYVINTSVVRDDNWGSANVTGTGFELLNKKNTIKFSGANALSQKFTRIDSLPETYHNQLGYKYYFGLEKVGGHFTYGVKHEALSNTFDQRDMGYYSTNNFRNFVVFGSYNQYSPGKIFLFSSLDLSARYGDNFTDHERTNTSIDANWFGMLKKYLGVFGGGGMTPTHNRDYYEPRVPGMYYITKKYYYVYAGISTDYRKKFAVDLKPNIAQYIQDIDGLYYNLDLGLRYRVNDRLALFYNLSYALDKYNEGFANFDSLGQVIIGGRKLITWENKLRVKFTFTEKMSLSMNARHYWNTGRYVRYFYLQPDGSMVDATTIYTGNNNYSYNAFNIDLVYNWIFSPGSQLSIVYKNAIETDESILLTQPRFNDNFHETVQSPQTNSLSIKLLYYLDYQNLKKRK
jgi:hypothetical protein